MKPLLSIAIQLLLVVVPVGAIIIVKKKVTAVKARVAAAVVVALVAGAVAYYAALRYGWQPLTRGGKSANLSPAIVGTMTTAGLLLALVFLALAKKRPHAPKA